MYMRQALYQFRRVFPCKDVPYRFPIRGAFCSVLCYLLIIYTLKTKTNIGIYPRHMALPPTSTFLEWPVTKLLGMGTTWNCKIWETECRASGKHTKKTMENHHFQWVNQLFLWQLSLAMLNYQRVCHSSAFSSRIYQHDGLAIGHLPQTPQVGSPIESLDKCNKYPNASTVNTNIYMRTYDKM